jgi:putative PIN family toxin of toxin-antitoxin system
MTPRVVFDCVTFLQGAARPAGPAGACFRLLEEGAIVLCLSEDVLTEVADVLCRPKTRQRFKSLTPERVEAFLREVQSRAVVLSEVPKVISLPRDPDDEPYLNLALAAGARYLITRDKDLLDLMNPASPPGHEFRKHFPDLTVLDPVSFLGELARSQKATDDPAGGVSGTPS